MITNTEDGVRRRQEFFREIDNICDKPEFREWLQREYPKCDAELKDELSRRQFMSRMASSFVLAGFGLTGCRRPEQQILPFARAPERYVHGAPEYYATAMPQRSGALPLVVESHDGRPTKIEGNTLHPAYRVSLGKHTHAGTDHYAQASILTLYDPDRALRFARKQAEIPRDVALGYLREVATRFGQAGGIGLAFLVQRDSSPSRLRVINAIRQRMPEARWYVHEPLDFHVHHQAATAAFGKSVSASWRLDKAGIIVSLDCDFIGAEENSVQFCRDFAKTRRLLSPEETISRLYVAEPLMTLTGVNADHRLRVRGSRVPALAQYLAAKVLGAAASGTTKLPTLEPGAARWLDGVADDLLRAENRGRSVVMAGHRQPLSTHILVHAINAALGNVGNTVTFHESIEQPFAPLDELAEALDKGTVDTLVIVRANPVYTAPADLNWLRQQRQAKTVIRLGYYEDETGVLADYHYPAAHYLEAWGDARGFDGSLLAVQPLISPLFGGVSDLEFLARAGGLPQQDTYQIVRETFAEFVEAKPIDAAWARFLHDGFLQNSQNPPVKVELQAQAVEQALAQESPLPPEDALEVVFHRDYSVDDGRWSNNAWLQELPDPLSRLTWDNVVLVSPATAAALGTQSKDVKEIGLGRGHVVELEVNGKKIDGPVWVQPGLADGVLALALGYGRTHVGRVGNHVGFNAYALRTSTTLGYAVGAQVRLSGRFHDLAFAQSHSSLEARPMVREANLAQYRERPDFARHMLTVEEPPSAGPLYPNPLDRLASELHQWGMVIDLSACVGCNACVIACQSENNVPVVGRDMVAKSREMHWLRIDRYYAGPAHEPQVVHQPMLCQHCEAAPCENVCPVNATVHDYEGLNLMIYNRCVGTRYCSNNCPWKIRRFNYFNYTKRPLDRLYESPILSATEGEWEISRWYRRPEASNRPALEWELLKMVKNPDVSVRMRGVMEKCTFCIQRIEQAKIAQKVKAGASGDIQVPDGAFTTACAQACPSGAIVFGNIIDENSAVRQLKANARNYTTLEYLNTKPRLTYMARLRNPNPAMPDYYEMPHTLKNYSIAHGNPLTRRGDEPFEMERTYKHEP